MAKSNKNRRPPTRPAASDARRLGPQNQPARSQGAQRRAARAQQHRSNLVSWIAIGLVVVVVAVFVVVKLTGSSTPSAAGTNSGISSGDHPATASVTAMVDPVTTIPTSVFNSIGTDGQVVPFTATKGQSALTAGGIARVVYEGAEYCPYCAMVRWSLVAAFARFGTFSGLKMTSSADDDGDIPTFSFLGASYTSKYVDFTPFEYLDRNQNPLQTVPKQVSALYAKYDGSMTSDTPAAPFNSGEPGIPFLDFGNRFVSSGAPTFLNPVLTALTGGGPDSTTASSAAAIAAALHDPSSAVASAIGAKYLLALANYFSGAICTIDHSAPSSVCSTPGVKAALTAMAKVTPVG